MKIITMIALTLISASSNASVFDRIGQLHAEGSAPNLEALKSQLWIGRCFGYKKQKPMAAALFFKSKRDYFGPLKKTATDVQGFAVGDTLISADYLDKMNQKEIENRFIDAIPHDVAPTKESLVLVNDVSMSDIRISGNYIVERVYHRESHIDSNKTKETIRCYYFIQK